jgi:hypothetical protein
LLEAGEATLYDGRLLHGGSANVGRPAAVPAAEEEDEAGAEADGVRVLFYATFRRAGADSDDANDAAHSLWHRYRGRFSLRQLRTEAQRSL